MGRQEKICLQSILSRHSQAHHERQNCSIQWIQGDTRESIVIEDLLFKIGSATLGALTIVWMIVQGIEYERIVQKFEEDDWWPYRSKDD